MTAKNATLRALLVILLLALLVILAGSSQAQCPAASTVVPTFIDASSGGFELWSPSVDEKGMTWPLIGYPMTCFIELDGQVVSTTDEVGPCQVFEFVDVTLFDDHPVNAWCTSAHIQGSGLLLAPQPIPARFPPAPKLGRPGRPVSLLRSDLEQPPD